MNDHYQMFLTTKETATIREEDGTTSRIEWSHGCNGTLHADAPANVFRNAEGEVVFAEALPIVEKGDCDETCNNGKERRMGGFIHPDRAPAEAEPSACAAG